MAEPPPRGVEPAPNNWMTPPPMTSKRLNIFVAKAGYAALLGEELADTHGVTGTPIGADALAFPENTALPHYLSTVFARQFLPLAALVDATDQRQAVDTIFRRIEVASTRANRQTGRWTIHSFALEDNAANVLAGAVEKAVLGLVKAKLPRLFKRYLPSDEIVLGVGPADFVVQVYASSASTLWASIGSFSSGISPYVGGTLRMRAKVGAPSRSARKLEEAFHALGRYPTAGETAVDLGAAPGGWTFSLARRGATVIAVDALELALPDEKKFSERVTHRKDNGLKYHPEQPVDWLVCDMIVASHETLKVLNYWLEKRWMTHFVVNLKLPKSAPWAAIKDALALLGRHAWPVMKARHLFHDRHEITLFGTKAPEPPYAPPPGAGIAIPASRNDASGQP